MFHVSLLRLYKRQGEDKDHDNVLPALLPTRETELTEHEVDMITGHEDDADNGKFYKVKWQGTGDLSWELEMHLQNCKSKVKEYDERSGLEDTRPR